jgi:hypothetical protein
MLKLLALLFLCSVIVSGQSLFDLYKPVIPPRSIDSPEERKEVTSLLAPAEKYNPEWIYHVIQYLKVSDEFTKDEEDASLNHLKYLKNEHLIKMENWISNESGIISDRSVSFAQWLRLWSYLWSLKSSPDKIETTVTDYKADENFRDYILYIFFTKEFQGYDRDVQYSTPLNKKISEITASLINVYNNTESYSRDDLDYYYEYTKIHYYLFKGSITEFIKEPAPFYLSEFLIKISSPEYLQNKSVSAGVQIDRYNEQSAYNLVYADDRFMLESELSGLTRNSVYYGGGVNIKLRQYKSYLSLLNLTLFYSRSSGSAGDPVTNSLGLPYYLIFNDNEAFKVDPNFEIGKFGYSSDYYQLKISTPVAYFLSALSLNAGVLLRYSSYNYSAVYTRRDTYYQNPPGLNEDQLINYVKDTEFSNSILNIRPLVSLNYLLYNLLNFRLSMHDLKIPQMEIFFNYNF